MLGLGLIVVAFLLWIGALKRRFKPPTPAFVERETEARIQITRERIAALEPRLGQPRRRVEPLMNGRGFECIERVD